MNCKVIKNKNYMLMLFGKTSSVFGDVLLNIALSLYVLKITGSVGEFATILGLGVLPQLLFGFFSGAIVDRLDKKKTLIFLDLIRGVYLVLLFILMYTGNLGITMIYITVMFFSLCDIFFGPTCIVVLPLILKDEELIIGNTIMNSTTEVTKAIGSVVSAFIFGIYGLGVILIIDAITFFASAISEIFMDFPNVKNNRVDLNIFQDVSEGFKIFLKDIRITSLVFNGVLTHLFLFPFFLVGIPYMIINVFESPDVYYGVVESTGAIALILSGLIVALTKKKFDIAQSINIGILGMLLSVVLFIPLGFQEFLFILNSNKFLVLVYFGITNFIMFLSFGYYLVFFVTFYQSNISKQLLGRFGATMMLLFALGRFLGFKLFGYLFNGKNLIYPVLVLGLGMTLKLIVHIPFVLVEKKEKQRIYDDRK